MTAALRPWSVAVYVGATLLVAHPLLGPGYVFALDHAMGPNVAEHYSRYLADNADPIQSKGGYALLLMLLDALLSPQVAQKVLLFAPFLLAGLGAHRLSPARSNAVALVGGLVYMVGPFAYVRAVSGQLGVLWAYALAPWIVAAWWRHVEGGSRRAFVAGALLLALTTVFQGHGAFLLLLVVGVDALVRVAREPRAAWRFVRAPLALVGVSLLVNAYWVAPVLLAPETTLTRIGEGDRDFFAMRDDGFPSVGVAALALHGFWREGYASYYAASPWLLAFPLALVVLAVHGLRSRHDARAWTMGASGFAGLVLGVGASSALTAPLFDLAWDHVPFFKGFRDSHKLLALLALAYAYLAPAGLEALLDGARAARRPSVRAVATPALALALVAPLALAGPLLHGFDGKLGLVEYPQEWAEAEAATADCAGAMLVLPWHLYLDLSWLPNDDKRVTNPAKTYFSCPVLSSDNVEAGTTASQSSDPRAAYVEHWLFEAGVAEGNPRGVATLGNLLAPVGITHVLVLKEADGARAAVAMAQQRDLRLVVDNARLQVYENVAPVAPAWRTDVVVPISSWDDLLPLSETRPLAGVVFAGPDAAPAEGARTPVEPRPGRAPGSLEVPDGAGRHLVFVPPSGPHGGWRLGGEAPDAVNLGVAPVFEDAQTASLAPAGTWAVAFPAWFVSIASVVALLAWSRRVGAGDARVGWRPHDLP